MSRVLATAAAALAVLALATGWHALGLRADLAKARQAHQADREAWATAAAAAQAERREVEQARQRAHHQVITDAQAQIDIERRDAGAARRAADGLRTAAAAAAARCGAAPGHTPVTGDSPPAASAGLVLADVLGSADARAGELAEALGAARAAGQACERAYDALRRPSLVAD